MKKLLISSLLFIIASLISSCGYEFLGTNTIAPNKSYYQRGEVVSIIVGCANYNDWLEEEYNYIPKINAYNGLTIENQFIQSGVNSTDTYGWGYVVTSVPLVVFSYINQTGKVKLSSTESSAQLTLECGEFGLIPIVNLVDPPKYQTITFNISDPIVTTLAESSIRANATTTVSAKTPSSTVQTIKYPVTAEFTLPFNQTNIDFVNGNTCQINSAGGSCSVAIKAKDLANQSTQTITANVAKLIESSVTLSINPDTRYIFMTDTNLQSDGNLGGFSGADAKCNADTQVINNPKLQGKTFKALLSGNNATTIGKIYKNLNESTIAVATTTNLVAENASIENKIDVGSLYPSMVWTGLPKTGLSALICQNWASNSNSAQGTVGYSTSTTASWSSSQNQTCDTTATLYCVEQ